MEKLRMHSPNFAEDNIEKVAAMFPGCVTESADADGNLKKSIDFDLLRQELSTEIVDGPRERYRLDWPGKRKALLTANAPIARALRPRREESVNFDSTKNLFIEGDNLNALKLLQETYYNKVKMIYIDPPYNTGNDFIYKDDFAESTKKYLLNSGQTDENGNHLVANTEANGRFHSDWLSMMYPRLRLARNLLRDDGVIFISIDDGEVADLRKMCDEVFGAENFVSVAVRRRRKSQANLAKNIAVIHEYIVVYVKSPKCMLNRIASNIDESHYRNPDKDPRGPYVTMPCTNKGGAKYSVTTPTGVIIEDEWRFKKETYNRLASENKLVFSKRGNGKPRYKLFLSEKKNTGTIPNSWWDELSSNQDATIEINRLFGGANYFNYPKPVDLLKVVIVLGSNNGDIVLDFFAGSSTTAHAVMQLNAKDGGKRQFIMIQLPEPCSEKSEGYRAGYKTIAEISKERIRRAGKKIKEECAAPDLDIGFRVFKIDSSNMTDAHYTPNSSKTDELGLRVDHIKRDRSSEDLFFQILLKWGVDITLPITRETIEGCEVFFVNDNALAACLERTGKITEELCAAIASRCPLRVVFRDFAFADDSVKMSARRIFEALSPHSELRTV
ncbi:MAG: site-specific DNA-methyltransferase [Salinispira sp.]